MQTCTQCGANYEPNSSGLLCGQCNSAVGMVKESVYIVERLLLYLKTHEQTSS